MSDAFLLSFRMQQKVSGVPRCLPAWVDRTEVAVAPSCAETELKSSWQRRATACTRRVETWDLTPAHCTLMLAALMMGHHFSISAL
jgi:hypothetical protein